MTIFRAVHRTPRLGAQLIWGQGPAPRSRPCSTLSAARKGQGWKKRKLARLQGNLDPHELPVKGVDSGWELELHDSLHPQSCWYLEGEEEEDEEERDRWAEEERIAVPPVMRLVVTLSASLPLTIYALGLRCCDWLEREDVWVDGCWSEGGSECNRDGRTRRKETERMHKGTESDYNPKEERVGTLSSLYRYYETLATRASLYIPRAKFRHGFRHRFRHRSRHSKDHSRYGSETGRKLLTDASDACSVAARQNDEAKPEHRRREI